MIIDAHSHLGNNNNKFYSAEDLVSSMDEAGIDYSLVITDRRDKYSMMDSVIELSAKLPRIKIIGDMSFAEFNNDEVEKICSYLKEGKIQGVKFYLGYEDYYPSDKKFDPIYSFCQKNNYPVVFHTGVLEVGHKGLLSQSHPLNIDEVANSYPDMKIVLAHMGNPWLMDCAAVVIKNPNVYADMSGFFTEYTTISKEETNFFAKQMKDLRVFMGSFEKLLFGTDYPLYNQKEYLEAVQSLALTDKETELVFSKNSQNIYNLS